MTKQTPDELYQSGYDAYWNDGPYPSDVHGKVGFRDAFNYDHPANDNDLAFDTYLSNMERVNTGDLVFGNEYRQKVKNAALGLLVAGFVAGFFVAAVIFENEEISAFVGRWM